MVSELGNCRAAGISLETAKRWFVPVRRLRHVKPWQQKVIREVLRTDSTGHRGRYRHPVIARITSDDYGKKGRRAHLRQRDYQVSSGLRQEVDRSLQEYPFSRDGC